VRAVIDEFVDVMVDDVMIGFFFTGVDKERLRQREYEFTARFLGAQIPYSGRPMRTAHSKHHIMGGQFNRRRQILINTLRKHGVEESVCDAWIAHVDRLRDQITSQAAGYCD